ncbi:hypothetical protein BDFB_007568 [Asbolus verrucosus]|uniref:Uncharacterized protein n=1 Tax=Asbolus verrucosus TaxID=1661398 RepID=A0A482VSL9_ASBVE|nr:hypothetical protein BDFB_007568 [Asbolus verrucosus]
MSDVKVKIEADEMPAPTRPAPRKKKQKKTETRIQVKSEKVKEEIVENTSESQGRDSDVILQDATVTMVNLLDSDDNEKTLKNEEDTVRSTRTKTKQKKKLGKRTRVLSSDEETDRTTEKRSKSGSEQLQNGDLSTKTNYEDAVSTLETNNATFVANSPVNKNLGAPPATMNATVVVENPKYVNNNLVPAPVTADDLLTDDESEDEKKRKTPPPTVTKIPSKFPKQVFSPFELSPVKKKVQAFEKLKEANSIPVRVTRTKTRAVAKEQEEVAADETEAKSVVKEKAKLFTPMTSKFLPTASSTNVKVNRLQSATSSNESLISAKSASALKASQAEYRERERRRREKEQEALKKREALLQAQIEEKKRKREEKQLKAQQQREALEKEKLKALEAQRLKDERHKQLLAEQEERKQKQKEELERKRMMAKMRAIEEKKREEEKRLEEERKAEEMAAKLARQDEKIAMSVQKQKMQRQQVPVYLKTKAPLLPTQDCYDSDDETHERGHIKEHSWARGGSLRELQFCMKAAGDTVMNSFFSRQAQTPDLQEIFEVIEPRKLKRSSSAVWHKPPRYTMMPCLDEYSEDDELFED